ncbi:MAG: hypothetical protein R3B84_05230 [Zavarzinella sp.]
MLMGDGSVRFISNGITQITWQKLGTIADGIPDGEY